MLYFLVNINNEYLIYEIVFLNIWNLICNINNEKDRDFKYYF